MKLSPYLHFNGQCEEAFTFYAKVFGSGAPAFFRFGQSPMAAQVGPDWAEKIMHVSLQAGEIMLMGCDAPPPHFQKPQGFRICLDISEVAEAERVFAALADGGKAGMALQETFWAKRYGDVVDRFGTPWMVNVSKPM